MSTPPASMAAVLIITRDPNVSVLADHLWAAEIDSLTVRNAEDMQRALERGTPEVAVVDLGLPTADLTAIEAALSSRAVRGRLLLCEPGSERQSLSVTGLHDQLPKPVTGDELALRVQAMLVRTSHASASPRLTRAGVGSSRRLAPGKGRIVAVFSAKAGVGKSTLAVNLAVGLAQLADQSVLLADADLCYGDVGVLLDTTSRYSLLDVSLRQMRTPESLQAITVDHPTGISVLLRPPDLANLETIDTSAITDALPVYRSLFNHVVVNMSSTLDEMNLAILDAVDQILLVTTPEMPAVHNTYRFLEVARKLGYTDKIIMVVNRADSGITPEVLKQTLGFPIGARVASAGRLVVESANEGTSLLLKDPRRREQITRDLVALVEQVGGLRMPAPQRLPFPFRLRGAA